MSHTPGPWTAKRCPCSHPNCSSGIVTPDIVIGQGVCSMVNARFIAAAPDMLAALEYLLAWAKAQVAPERLYTTSEITHADAAIAKAKGQ